MLHALLDAIKDVAQCLDICGRYVGLKLGEQGFGGEGLELHRICQRHRGPQHGTMD